MIRKMWSSVVPNRKLPVPGHLSTQKLGQYFLRTPVLCSLEHCYIPYLLIQDSPNLPSPPAFLLDRFLFEGMTPMHPRANLHGTGHRYPHQSALGLSPKGIFMISLGADGRYNPRTTIRSTPAGPQERLSVSVRPLTVCTEQIYCTR